VTFLVPFDGSPLARAALVQARVYAVALNEAPPSLKRELRRAGPVDVVAMSVVPDSARYAREKGWIGDDEALDVRAVAGRLHEQVTDIDPGAGFHYVRVDGAAMAGTISSRLRRRAEEDDVSVVFVGSENAGRIITPLTSVAGGVTASMAYDVHIVRHPMPSEARERLRSEFFFVD
jgi:hypothetical protein